MTSFVELRDIRVSFAIEEGDFVAVDGVSLDIAEGQAVGIVGESGSGKSTLARSLLSLLPAGGQTKLSGTLSVDGKVVPWAEVPRLRGGTFAMVFQDPLSFLDPLMRVGKQIAEAVERHDRNAGPNRVGELLGLVQLPESSAHAYPHELSGGMRQRALLAVALACKPRLLVADEPTTALDVTTQKEILALIKDIQSNLGMSLLLISHDLGIVSSLCSVVHVMYHGKVIESGTVRELFGNPKHDYSKLLMQAARATGSASPVRPAPPAEEKAAPVLEVRDARKAFKARGGKLFQALGGVDIAVYPGETLAIVGESGSGKSTLARVALALLKPDSGVVRLKERSLFDLSREDLRRYRTDMHPVFQDSTAAFNPRTTVREVIRQALMTRTGLAQADIEAEILKVMEQVRLAPAARLLDRFPHQLSGGQRQRLGIARALATDPVLIVADEPLSGADVSIRNGIIELLTQLQEETGIAYLFITHDLWLARTFAHRIAVMHKGLIVEQGDADQVTARPRHDYTRRLLDSIPAIDL